MTEAEILELSEKLASFCANKKCVTLPEIQKNCDICMYEKGRADAIEDFVNALEKLDKKRKGIGIDIIDVFEVEEKLKERK